jgi:hypothetical protein
MGAGIVVIWWFFVPYLVAMVPFCLKVADASSATVGWAMATVLIFSPLALYAAMFVPFGR